MRKKIFLLYNQPIACLGHNDVISEEWRKEYRFVLAFRMIRCPENNRKNINASFLFKRRKSLMKILNFYCFQDYIDNKIYFKIILTIRSILRLY